MEAMRLTCAGVMDFAGGVCMWKDGFAGGCTDYCFNHFLSIVSM